MVPAPTMATQRMDGLDVAVLGMRLSGL